MDEPFQTGCEGRMDVSRQHDRREIIERNTSSNHPKELFGGRGEFFQGPPAAK
jgi:hypothetical protein